MKDKKLKLEIPNNIKLFLPALVSLLVISIVTSLFSEIFLTSRNLMNVLNQATTTGIMGVGVTFIITAGQFDLSSASVVCLSALISSDLCANFGLNPYLAILVAVAIGVAAGFLNGFLVAHVGLIPFIATMGTMNMFKGLSLMYSKSLTVHSIPEAYTRWGSTRVFDVIPSGIIISIILYIIGYILLSKTVFGHKVSAVGGNREAARLAGINAKNVIMSVYVIAGFCYAIAGVVLTGRVGAAYPTAADGCELDVIAGIVIGGTSMSGGRGTHIGTWVGILLVAVINNAINLLGISAYATKFVQGIVILLAVIVEILRSKAAEKRL